VNFNVGPGALLIAWLIAPFSWIKRKLLRRSLRREANGD
jgi:hypothetical protein